MKKQRVLWFGDKNRDFFQSIGQAHTVPPVTTFVPVLDITNPDVGLSLAEEIALGGPTQGTLQGQLVGQAYSLKRLIAHMSIATELTPDDASSGTPRARHVLVRFGIFKGAVDESGTLLNGRNFSLSGFNAAATEMLAGTLSRESRFVWLYERIVTNYLGLGPNSWYTGMEGIPNPEFMGSRNSGPWNTTGGRFAFPIVREVDIDIGPLGTAGPEERWFLARYACDAEATSPTTGASVDVKYHWNPRLLIARSSAFRKKPGV